MTRVQRRLLERAVCRPDPALVAHHGELASAASGRVLEIGAGIGNLFGHYPTELDELIALEPEPQRRRQAEGAAARCPFPVRLVDGRAEQLPVDTASIDTVVCSEVLCSVAQPQLVLAEIRRVLRDPGALLLVYEHVLARRGPGRLAQRLVDRAGWPELLGGCHTARDTIAMIDAAGFRWERRRRVWQASSVLVSPSGPHVLGVARRH